MLTDVFSLKNMHGVIFEYSCTGWDVPVVHITPKPDRVNLNFPTNSPIIKTITEAGTVIRYNAAVDYVLTLSLSICTSPLLHSTSKPQNP